MAYNESVRAKARAMYEAGNSMRDIENELRIDLNTILDWSHKEAWVKGKSQAEIRQAEHNIVVEAAAKHGLTKERILEELAILALADPADLYDEDADGVKKLKSFKDMGKASRTIKGIKTRTNRRYNIKTPDEVDIEQTVDVVTIDKLGALTEAGNILGIKKDGEDGQDAFKSFFNELTNVIASPSQIKEPSSNE